MKRGLLCLWLAVLVLVTSATGCRRAYAPPNALQSVPAAKPSVVTLAAVGDVLLARYVCTMIAKNGADYPFEKTKDIISGADIAFLNLECPLSKRGVPQRRKFLFRAAPMLAGTLSENGFDIASLANNHTLDYGRRAMMDTIEAVEKAGMVPIGAGKNRDEALKLRVIERNGLRIGFIAYSDLASAGVVRLEDRPTIAGVNIDELPEQVKSAKSECDTLVVSFHWGIEYKKKPSERQKKLAKLCIDNGADLILGHHPHVLQTVEVYKKKPIIYSMGGFVWDCKVPNTDKSAIYMIELGKSSAKLTNTIPLKITKCQPTGVRN